MMNQLLQLTRVSCTLFLCCAFSLSSLSLLANTNLNSLNNPTDADELAVIDSKSSFEMSEGNECTSATTIASLPYNTSGNTLDFANDYSSTDVPDEAVGAITNGTGSTSYLSGPEAVYAYTPASNVNITAELTGFTGWTALWVFTGCPFSSMVGYHTSTSGTERSIPELPLTAGVTYYFVVSTWESQTASTAYNLNITENVSCPPGSETEGLLTGASCDDGDPTTFDDTVSPECTCIGTPAIPGQICGTALEVGALPYTTTDNTSGYSDDYTGTPGASTGCGSSSSYLNGDDVVYAYTASSDISINLTLTPTGTWSGIFVYASCADIGTTCLAGVANSGSDVRTIENLAVANGQTIYIVISTFASPQSVAYTLDIIEYTECPPGSETEGLTIGSPCDDGDPTTLFDTVSEECTCVGTPSSPGQICENPLPINGLPFLTNDNTSNYLDIYSGAPGTFTNCGTSSSYLNGEEVVYSFTPAQAMTVEITMTPTATSTGVFVYGACADIGTDCIAGDASFTNGPKVIEELALSAGETIYIVVSTLSATNMDYTLEIVELPTCAPGTETEGLIIGNPCDDGDPTTIGDTVSPECTCIGTPAIPGQICETALEVGALPYTTTDNTSGYSDDYTGTPGASTGCGSSSSYLNGDDVVYTYTATSDVSINLTLTPSGTWSGIFVYGSCADIGTTCLAGVANSNSNVRTIENFAVANGQTIYIVISTFAAPQSVAYTLDIIEYTVCPPGSETEGLVVGSPCDDGDPTTLFDTVSEECTCVGTPSSPGQVCENPLPINGIPFITNDNTSNYLDVYSGAPGTFTNCGTSSSYLNGEDVVYSFTPAQAMTVTITMTPTATSTGVFVYGACADIGTDCIAGDASSTNGPKEIEALALNAGETIYIVVSTLSATNMDYTLEIIEYVVCPPGSETEGLVVGSDCEIDGFFDAVVTADCECVGTPYDCPLLNANIGDPCGTYGTVQSDCSCLEVTYCASAFSNTADEHISNVSFTGISNPSGSTNYANYDITFDLNAGETSPITVSVTNSSASSFTETVRVWIDFDQDGIYDPLTEQFDIGSQSVPAGETLDFTADIAVPADALPGVTGMRVTLRFNTYAGPCDNATWGEVENYMVNIASSQVANLNGTVIWNAACGDRATTVRFYEPGTDNLMETYLTSIGADGSFSIADVAEGTFDVFVKVDGHLQKGFGNVTISSGDNDLVVGIITPGDINNVDGINIDDLTILLSAFGSTTGDPNFNPLADLNCDGDVNIDDLTLLLPNFGQSGDNAPLQ